MTPTPKKEKGIHFIMYNPPSTKKKKRKKHTHTKTYTHIQKVYKWYQKVSKGWKQIYCKALTKKLNEPCKFYFSDLAASISLPIISTTLRPETEPKAWTTRRF